MPLHPRRGMSSDGVSVDPRARDWIPTRRGVKMSVGELPHISTTIGTPSDAAVQDEDDAGQAGPVVHGGSAALPRAGAVARQQGLDDFP